MSYLVTVLLMLCISMSPLMSNTSMDLVPEPTLPVMMAGFVSECVSVELPGKFPLFLLARISLSLLDAWLLFIGGFFV